MNSGRIGQTELQDLSRGPRFEMASLQRFNELSSSSILLCDVMESCVDRHAALSSAAGISSLLVGTVMASQG